MASSKVEDLLKALKIEGVVSLNKQLGQGAYGRVFTVKYRGEVCAAKEIHPILIEKAPPVEKKTIVHNFIKECHQCSLMQHPSIVRFLGVYYSSRNSDLPIMVMELMNESLTSFVKNNQSKIPVTSKLSILYDVSLGLNYLHTNTPVIIHRDLSPNNVMLTSELVAKIGDLGVAKVVQADSRQTRSSLTMAPGTEDFMPPETFEDNPVYSTAVDVFSFAGIALHVFAEEWPRPGGQKRRDPVTRKLVPVTEAERRQEYFDKIPKGVVNLKQLFEQCLDDEPEGRPPVQEICMMINTLKVSDTGDLPKPDSKSDNHASTKCLSSIPVSKEHNMPQNLNTNEDFAKLRDHYHTILRLMPNHYQPTVAKLQDYISDDQICVILSSSNSTDANKIILDCLIERINCRKELLDLCDQLESITTSHDLKSVINEIRSESQQSNQLSMVVAATNAGTQSFSSGKPNDSMFPSLPLMPLSKKQEIPHKLIANQDFAGLKEHYHTILHLMPNYYQPTIAKLQDCISDDQICVILSSSNSTDANKIILDCLIDRMKYRKDLLVLCDQLESIITSHEAKILINKIRSGVQHGAQFPVSTPDPTNTQLPISSDQNVSVPRVKYLQPPPLPNYHVNRQSLLNDIATKLLQATIDSNKYEATLTIIGTGGFGKTTTVISLCHHPRVKDQFTNGFIFVELGPQATEPVTKLRDIYNLLTGKHCGINVVKQKINQLTSDYYRNLLVIIDDVWHVEDAEPLVKAFSNCKTILTTRMNDIEQYIPSKQSVTLGPMTDIEAVSLLTNGVIDSSQLSQEDMRLLGQLAHDVHLWPLLLSLIRGQLLYNVKSRKFTNRTAIESVQANLHQKGLTVFDKNNIENTDTSCTSAVKACIDVTFDLLTKLMLNRMTSLVSWTGIGTPIETAILSTLWNISRKEAEDTIDLLCTYGIIKLKTDVKSSNRGTQKFVEVHAVISQYIIESRDSEDILMLSPCGGLNTVHSINNELEDRFVKSYREQNTFSREPLNYLKYQLGVIELFILPFLLSKFNMYLVNDPHVCIVRLQEVLSDQKFLPNNNILKSFGEEAESLIVECQHILKDTHNLWRRLNQPVQRNLCIKDYDKVVKDVEEFFKSSPSCIAAQKAITLVKKIIPYCNGKVLYCMKLRCEDLYMITYNYHKGTLMTLPYMKLVVKIHKQITNSLLTGSPDLELFRYIISGRFDEEEDILNTNYLIRVQEVAPIYVREKASQQ